jgi:5-methylcytosine-specific restriction protein B
VFYESLRIAAALSLLGVSSRDAALDHIVLFKILPRIHGSRRRVEPVLRGIAAYAADPDGPSDFEAANLQNPALPMTMAKVQRMLRAVEINQFVSFTE